MSTMNAHKKTGSKLTNNTTPAPGGIAATRGSKAYWFHQKTEAVRAIEKELGEVRILSLEQRKAYRGLVARTPTEVIEHAAALAAQHGGTIGSVTLDPDKARETIAYVAASAPFVAALRELASLVEDDGLAMQGELAESVRTLIMELDVMVRSPANKRLVPARHALRSMTRRRAPVRKPVAVAAAETPSAVPATVLVTPAKG